MKPTAPRRRSRIRRALPYSTPDSDGGPRTLYCVDLRAVEAAWSLRPLVEVRFASRGGRLGALFAQMDLDPRRSVRHNARTLTPARARDLFDALCEELADSVIHDVPAEVWRGLLPLLVPHGSGECPYPKEPLLPQGDTLAGGLVMLTEGALAAEAAAVACSRGAASGGVGAGDGSQVDPLLWADILASLHPMLAAVRDRNRVILIEA